MMQTHVAALLLALSGLSFSAALTPAHAQDARARAIDSIFSVFVPVAPAAPSPGCAVGVVSNGDLVYSRGYGLANLDYSRPLDGKSVFYLASVSKQFTAAAIAIAATQGKLSLDDDVRKYITELPDYGTVITIRHLIHHTSGIRDYLTLIPLSGRRADDHWTDTALLALITRQRALNFAPGAEHLYSNTGYVLLAEIIRRATGQSLRQFADEQIFQPLGMSDTHFHDDATEIVPARVIGYARAGDRWRMNHWFSFDKVGDGGLYSTIEDLARWDENFYTGKVGGAALLRQLHESGRLASGDTIRYAFGLSHGAYRGVRTVEHGGSLAGFRTNLLRFPEQRFSAIVLCNTPTANPTLLSRAIADVYIGDRLGPPPPLPRPVVLPPVNVPATAGATAAAPPRAQPEPAAKPAIPFADYAGTFRSEELDALFRLAVEADSLALYRIDGRFVLRPGSASDSFLINNVLLRFQREAGRVSGFVVDAGRVRGIRFDRVTAPR